MKKVVLAVLAVFVITMVLAGCQQTGSKTAGTDTKKYVLGFSKSSDTPWLAKLETALQAKAKALGAEVILTSAASHSEKQISDIEAMLTQKVDAIILNPVDRDACGVIVDKVKEKGIPLIEVNTFTKNDKYDVYVGSPEEQAGKLQAEWLVKNIGPKGNLCIIYGEMGHSGQIGREKGLLDQLGITKDSKDSNKWNVLAAQTANWVRADAKRITEDWLMTYGDKIQAICAQDDEMAQGALQAVQEKKFQDKVKVLGIDGMDESIKSISEGGQSMTALQDAVAQGEKSVEVAIGLLKGEKFSKTVDIPFTGIDATNAKDFLQ